MTSASFQDVASIIKNCYFLTLLSILFCTSQAYAARYPLPPNNEALLGNIEYAPAASGETIVSVAKRHNLGLNAIVAANPDMAENTIFTTRTTLKIPTLFLLPPTPRQGIVINLPEMRIYYYPKDSHDVLTFPIGIGRIGRTIPITNTSIVKKTINPVWVPTENIRQFNEERGIILPSTMPPGPDNPLGPYAIYLQVPTYLIHSTIFPESIGRRASFGCIRMNPQDIEEFFPLVETGTPVAIIDMPNKIGWEDNTLFLESHEPLEERQNQQAASLNGVVKSIENSLPKDRVTLINWQLVAYLTEQPDGIPHEIGIKLE